MGPTKQESLVRSHESNKSFIKDSNLLKIDNALLYIYIYIRQENALDVSTKVFSKTWFCFE
jgi:hypothetical protein